MPAGDQAVDGGRGGRVRSRRPSSASTTAGLAALEDPEVRARCLAARALRPRRAASTIFSWEGRCCRRRLDGQQIRSVTGATPTQYDVGELAKLGRPLTAPGWTTGLRGALDHSLRPQGRLHLGRPGRGHPAERGGPRRRRTCGWRPAASDSGCRWSRSTGRTSSTSDRRPRPRRSRRDEAPGPHGDHTRATSGTGRPQMPTMSFRMSETKSERLSRSARSARQCPAFCRQPLSGLCLHLRYLVRSSPYESRSTGLMAQCSCRAARSTLVPF